MKQLENFYRASLTVACGNSTGKIYVDVLPQLDEGYLVISPSVSTKREIIAYNGKGTDEIGNYINVTQRGLGGTNAQPHSIGEPIRGNLTAEHWNEMKEEVDNSVKKTGNETIAGVKTFSSFPILPDDTPTEDNQAVHKKYVDDAMTAGAPNASSTTKGITKLSVDPEDPNNPIAVGSNDPILEKIPSSLPVPVSQGGTGATTTLEARINLDVPSNSEVVKLTGNQTIGGVKTFTSIPVLPNLDPTNDNQATRKSYVDKIPYLVIDGSSENDNEKSFSFTASGVWLRITGIRVYLPDGQKFLRLTMYCKAAVGATTDIRLNVPNVGTSVQFSFSSDSYAWRDGTEWFDISSLPAGFVTISIEGRTSALTNTFNWKGLSLMLFAKPS